jgi:hypothetical protein
MPLVLSAKIGLVSHIQDWRHVTVRTSKMISHEACITKYGDLSVQKKLHLLSSCQVSMYGKIPERNPRYAESCAITITIQAL